ncbi:peptide chain release factor N(5)-glutamine methyltransferase [Miniphocaeibacter halophilus]|uniref:Peptide chain release factor N(5)-glutamine methyltransferase n=1 Tax=Miniphocaeibacter halophilus TaxID=2931922 RepID=A0AC61MQR0_9FIRM|nr:peptide chain release factor N(5)-glutamine methyltransferase [Miniphocaeibacter halophilus]QQK07911.1 peptide chain release factor N(5)-glutamine methyltransferase [Miniphocaeibacter halophilus]
MVIQDVLDLFSKVDGEIILKHYFNINKIDIVLNKNKKLEKKQEDLIYEIYKKYKRNYPLQYILGQWNFYGRDFFTEEGILIPRFETEILVEKILDLNIDFRNILEIGVGSGIISITLALEMEKSQIIGVDISQKAIDLANRNKEKFNVKNCKFIKSDLFSSVSRENKFDLIVSNPPYINLEDMDKLEEKLSYEPENALYGGKDGLDFYREIIEKSKDYLKSNGVIAFEIGYNQGESIKEILSNHNFMDIEIFKDYNDFDRCIIARR